jgi:hypothetical protein
VENETKRYLQLMLETLQEQWTGWDVADPADRVGKITRELLRPESPALAQHFFSILDVMRKQDNARRVPGVSDAIERVAKELDKPDVFTTKHDILSMLEIMRVQQTHYPVTGLSDSHRSHDPERLTNWDLSWSALVKNSHFILSFPHPHSTCSPRSQTHSPQSNTAAASARPW